MASAECSFVTILPSMPAQALPWFRLAKCSHAQKKKGRAEAQPEV
jgi:hypothetical protein